MALLQITLDISPENRPAAAGVYQQYMFAYERERG